MSEPCCENPAAVLKSYADADILEAAVEGILTAKNAHSLGITPFGFLTILLLAEIDSGDGTWDGCGACGLEAAVYGNPSAAIANGTLNAGNAHALGLSRGEFYILKAIAESLAA
jgi:hypothetical protein